MPSKTFFYHPQARLRVADVGHLEKAAGHSWDLTIDGDPNGKVPVNADYRVSVMLPEIRPTNLVPTGTVFPSGLLVHAMVFKASDLGHAAFHLRAGVGKPGPGSHPQRKSKHQSKKKARVQEFRFLAGNFQSGATVVFLFQSLHRFFDDRNAGVPFAQARFVVKELPRLVA